MKAPEFTLEDQDGQIHSLRSYRGKKVVLYFYPKDMTPGCTTEACNFRDDHNEYEKRGAVILGVSGDSKQSHKKFIDKNDLPFPLLVDEDYTVAKAFGAFGEKSFFGKKIQGIKRQTFVIDEEGNIIKHFEKVKVADHSKEILELLK